MQLHLSEMRSSMIGPPWDFLPSSSILERKTLSTELLKWVFLHGWTWSHYTVTRHAVPTLSIFDPHRSFIYVARRWVRAPIFLIPEPYLRNYYAVLLMKINGKIKGSVARCQFTGSVCNKGEDIVHMCWRSEIHTHNVIGRLPSKRGNLMSLSLWQRLKTLLHSWS